MLGLWWARLLNTVIPIFSAGVAAGGDFESIATVTVGSGGASSVTFSSIPSGFAHLQIRGIARTDRAVTFFTPLVLQFNSDTTAGNYYSYHILVGDTTAAAAYASSTSTTAGSAVGEAAGGSGASNTFSPNIIDILDYANTNKYKTIRSLSGNEGQTTNLDNEVKFGSSLWMSTSAISSITIKINSGNNFTQYSHFALYGIKSA